MFTGGEGVEGSHSEDYSQLTPQVTIQQKDTNLIVPAKRDLISLRISECKSPKSRTPA
jgi:hypothetical protein